MDLELLRGLAHEAMGRRRSHPDKELGNKYYHGQRVAALSLWLRERLFPGDGSHDGVLTVAGWFHDIANGEEHHAAAGAQRTRALLTPHLTAAELEEVCGIIGRHDDRMAADREGFSPWLRLQQDADMLDHFGTFTLWMSFRYTSPNWQTMADVLHWLQEQDPQEHPRFRRELHFDLSREIYEEKMAFVREFSERFAVESAGGVWGF